MGKSNDKKVEQLQKAWAKEAAARAEEEFNWRAERIRGRCESPIEELLGLAVFHYIHDYIDDVEREDGGVHWMVSDYTWPNEPGAPFDGIYCYQQAQIGNYRADFLFYVRDEFRGIKHFVVVECDGHDYHERTKEQAARDKSRDRWMTSKQVTLLRFTGSEIWRDPEAAADEVCDLLCDIYIRRPRNRG